MKTATKACSIALGVIAVLCTLIYIPLWLDDAAAKRNKDRVNKLVQMGADLRASEQILKNNGFRLMYEKPITPTFTQDYLQQIVIVGSERVPNAFESFAYAAQLPWMPFTHRESPYVIIDATLQGRITEIR